MRTRPYGDEEPPTSPLTEFLCGFFMVAIGFPTQIGWVFQSLGWISGTELLGISAALGVLGGIYMAKECARQAPGKEKYEAK